MSMPAWGSDASFDKLALQETQQQPGESASPPARCSGSVTQNLQPHVDEGSGVGEPTGVRDEDKRNIREFDREQFLNEVWNAS